MVVALQFCQCRVLGVLFLMMLLGSCGKSSSDENVSPSDYELEDKETAEDAPVSNEQLQLEGTQDKKDSSELVQDDDVGTGTVQGDEKASESSGTIQKEGHETVEFHDISCKDVWNFVHWNVSFHADFSGSSKTSLFKFQSHRTILGEFIRSFDDNRIFLSKDIIDHYVEKFETQFEDRLSKKEDLCQFAEGVAFSLSRFIVSEADEVLEVIATLDESASYQEEFMALDDLKKAKFPYVNAREDLRDKRNEFMSQRYAKLSKFASYLSDQEKKDILRKDVLALKARMKNLGTSQAYSMFLQAHAKSFKWGGAFYDAGHSYLDLGWLLSYMGVEVVLGKDDSYLMVDAVTRRHFALDLYEGDIIEAIRVAPSSEWIPVSKLTRGVIYEDFKLSETSVLPNIEMKVYPSAQWRGGGDYHTEEEILLHWLAYLPSFEHYLSQFKHDFTYYLVDTVDERKEAGEEDVVADKGAEQAKLLYVPLSPYHIGSGQLDAVDAFQEMIDSIFEKWNLAVMILDLRRANLDHRYMQFIASIVDMFAGFDLPFLIDRSPHAFSSDSLMKHSIPSQKGKKYHDIPLVLLVSEETSGTAELFVSYLSARNRALVVGDFATGAAGVQMNQIRAKSSRGVVSYLDVPFFKYYTSIGQPLFDVGWISDVMIPSPVSLYQSMMFDLAPEYHSLEWDEKRSYDKVKTFPYLSTEMRGLLADRSYQRAWIEHKDRSEDLPEDAMTLGNAAYWFAESQNLKKQLYPHIPINYLHNPMWYIPELIELFHGYVTSDDYSDVTIDDRFVRAYVENQKDLEKSYAKFERLQFEQLAEESSEIAAAWFFEILEKDYLFKEALTIAVDYYNLLQQVRGDSDLDKDSAATEQEKETSFLKQDSSRL